MIYMWVFIALMWSSNPQTTPATVLAQSMATEADCEVFKAVAVAKYADKGLYACLKLPVVAENLFVETP